ncbi:uncharacterized protein A4U43_C04F35210 [Asparagus officinalis]|uniref:Uncharacterized protein n=1 Tax=Asparagus officinalis TaxID=4686 RepID=A0A5P1F6H1_ASPOF|nr:uncharacterized protein A4U43_C04F35210 [Asparagus officinalis]
MKSELTYYPPPLSLSSSLLLCSLSMAAHLLILAKLKLLNGGGQSNWRLMAMLFCPFALKLPLAMHMPSSYTDLAISLRLFIFRLNRIFFFEGSGDRRWERALRLFHERVLVAGARSSELDLSDISMFAL